MSKTASRPTKMLRFAAESGLQMRLERPRTTRICVCRAVLVTTLGWRGKPNNGGERRADTR